MNIDSAAFNLPATVKAFKGKLKRNDFQRELIHTGLMHKITIDDVPERYQAAVKALLKADA